MRRTRLRSSAAARARAGFSAIELAITSLLLVMLLGAAGIVGRTNMETYKLTTSLRNADVAAQRAVQRIASELKFTGASRLNPDPELNGFVSSVDFDQVVDIVNGEPVWAPLARIAFEYEPGELNDGIDNDGDGLIDEGRIVLTRNVGGVPTRVVLVNGVSEYAEGELPNGIDDNGDGLVDEPGFCIQRNGDVLDLRLTVEAVDPQGRVFQRTVETSVRMRNH